MKSQIYETIDELLSDLNSREADVIKKRFGINSKPLSLEKIGKEYGITRERVRQIEDKALKKISHKSLQLAFFEKTLYPIINDLLGDLKIKREIFIYRKLNEIYDIKEEEMNILRFFFNIFEKIYYKEENRLFNSFLSTQKHFFEKGLKILNHLYNRLEKNKDTILKEEDVLKILLNEIKIHWNIQPSVEEILEFLKISKVIKRNPLNEYGHFKHPRITPVLLKNKIKIIFEIEKRPLHFNEIHQKLLELSEIEDELLPFVWKKRYTNHSIHNALLENDDFVKYGRGKYVLREWGYEEGHIIALMRKILEERKEVDVDELYEFIRNHKECAPATFRLYLYKYFKVKDRKVYFKND